MEKFSAQPEYRFCPGVKGSLPFRSADGPCTGGMAAVQPTIDEVSEVVCRRSAILAACDHHFAYRALRPQDSWRGRC